MALITRTYKERKTENRVSEDQLEEHCRCKARG
jgi:hypothetical protein